jgi:hypothetical protein
LRENSAYSVTDETLGTVFAGRYDGFLLRIIKLVIHKASAVPPAFVAKRRELGGIKSEAREDKSITEAVA